MLLAAATAPAASEPITIKARVIERFKRPEPGERMTFVGGLVLNGPRGFGGLSGLLVEGPQLLAVGDTGHWLTARLVMREGRLAGVAQANWQPRIGVDGRPVGDKRTGDAEALARVPGAVLVAVEQEGVVLRHPADGLAVDLAATPTALHPDAALAGAARRHGLEAMAALPGGQVVVIAEGNARTGGSVPAFRLPGAAFAIARRGDWSITGADALPGGDVLIVERRYGGGLDVGLRVRRLGADAVAHATGTIDGPVLLEAGFAAEIDNMEAIAAEVIAGRIVVTLMSDDNHSLWQRTLLLRFVLDEARPRAKPPPLSSSPVSR